MPWLPSDCMPRLLRDRWDRSASEISTEASSNNPLMEWLSSNSLREGWLDLDNSPDMLMDADVDCFLWLYIVRSASYSCDAIAMSFFQELVLFDRVMCCRSPNLIVLKYHSGVVDTTLPILQANFAIVWVEHLSIFVERERLILWYIADETSDRFRPKIA